MSRCSNGLIVVNQAELGHVNCIDGEGGGGAIGEAGSLGVDAIGGGVVIWSRVTIIIIKVGIRV